MLLYQITIHQSSAILSKLHYNRQIAILIKKDYYKRNVIHMKKNILTTIVSILFMHILLAQSADHIKGGHFSKKVEYNVIMKGMTESDNRYNLNSKSALDRVFFGEINSPVEFVLRTLFEGASGLRIVKNESDNTYRVEVTNMPNSDEVTSILLKKENEILIPNELQRLMTLDVLDKINEYNKNVIYTKQKGEIYEPYRTESKSLIISKSLARKLHRKIISLIDSFKAEGIPPLIADGNEVTFRCVVGDELWTLTIHSPQRKALQLSDLCKQIIADSNNNKLNESAYLKLLKEID